MTPKQIAHILGIDIAKPKFDVCLRAAAPDGPRHAHAFPNHAQDFKALNRWLAKHPAPQLHPCLEATSRYGDALTRHLYQHGHTVSLVNPRHTRHYADSRLVHTQNDTMDAALIADFCASQNPRPWQPVSEGKRQFQDLVRTRGFFLNQSQQCRNRLETADPSSAQHLRQHIRQLDATIGKLKKPTCSRPSPTLHAQWNWPIASPGKASIAFCLFVSITAGTVPT